MRHSRPCNDIVLKHTQWWSSNINEALLKKVVHDIIGPFWKTTKTPFLPKLITWACNIKMRWDQKGWLEDISRFLKSPRTLPKIQNWRSYALLKLGIFPKLPKVNYPQNFKFCQMVPLFSTWFDLVTLHTCPIFSFVSNY